MDKGLVCWKCGTSIEDLPLPLGRLVECRECRAQLHACKLCEFFDQRRANQCREPIADFVQDKERANFCGYFKPRPRAYTAVAQAPQADLKALFGLAAETGEETGSLSATEHSRKKLDDLFKK